MAKQKRDSEQEKYAAWKAQQKTGPGTNYYMNEQKLKDDYAAQSTAGGSSEGDAWIQERLKGLKQQEKQLTQGPGPKLLGSNTGQGTFKSKMFGDDTGTFKSKMFGDDTNIFRGLFSDDLPTQEGGLPKLGESKAYREMLARKKQFSDEGVSTQEQEAFRSKMAQQMSQAEQTAGLRMGAALGGAQGAGVAAQQAGLQQAGRMGRAGIERDIFLEQEKAKRTGLEAYGKTLETGLRFDIGTKAQERAMDIQQQSLQQSLESAGRQADIQSSAARQAGKSRGLLGKISDILGF